jgi:ElaB/YqjD/DUF883 family membrane-anchored ribosome-binding protein
MNRMAANLKEEVHEAEEFLRNASPDLGEVRQRLQAALDAAKSAVYEVEDKAVAYAQSTKRTMSEHVLESVGVALGVGLLLGIVLGRR